MDAGRAQRGNVERDVGYGVDKVTVLVGMSTSRAAQSRPGMFLYKEVVLDWQALASLTCPGHGIGGLGRGVERKYGAWILDVPSHTSML